MARKHGCCSERLRQTKILLKKNFIILYRNTGATLVQILVPFIFIALLFLLKFAVDANSRRNADVYLTRNSVTEEIIKVPRCILQPGQTNCWTIGFTPSNDIVAQEIMNELIKQNDIPANELISFKTESEANNYMAANRNTTQGVIHLRIDYGCDSAGLLAETKSDECYAKNHTKSEVLGIRYVIQFNKTSIYDKGRSVNLNRRYLFPFEKALDSAILSVFGSGNNTLDIILHPFAHPELALSNIISSIGPFFFFGALMFNFVIQTGNIVLEKELFLRESMRVMGLLDFSYWLSWGIVNLFMNLISSLLLIAAGAIFQLDFFLKNDFGTYFVLFILFGISMVPLAFLVSTLLSQAATATTLGFAIFLIGTMIQAFTSLIYVDTTDLAIRVLFSFLPFALLAKGLGDLGNFTSNELKPGMRWSEIETYDKTFPLTSVYTWFAIDTVFFLVIALFLDNVLYMKRPVWFFLLPSYWSGNPKRKTMAKLIDEEDEEFEAEQFDEDVLAEEEFIKEGKTTDKNAVVIDSLAKTYMKKKYCCFPDKENYFRAVKNIYLTIENGSLLCLLGHNGAGKTTTIKMLTGLFPPSGGDATIFGHSIIDGMEEIRQVMGVCPQHDILWRQLTAREHLELFADFKDISEEEMESEVAERLRDVALTVAADIPAGNYSGGMKRRLSVAIALIGDPKIVLLDEPTTGMDPVSRRGVWNLIERVKRGRVTILTTHSMEEADILSDKIAIMKGGRIASIGTSLRLKNKYGSGYSVSIVAKEKKMKEIKNFVMNTFEEEKKEQYLLKDVNTDDKKSPSSSKSNKKSPSSSKIKEVNPSDSQKQSKKTPKSSSSSKSNKSSSVGGEVEADTQKSPSKKQKNQDKDSGDNKKKKSGKDDKKVGKYQPNNVELVSTSQTVSTFKIPLSLSSILPTFFEKLEGAKKKLGIQDYQLMMTTLEEVFLRVAEEPEPEEKVKAKGKSNFKRNLIIGLVVGFLLLAMLIGGIVVGVRRANRQDPLVVGPARGAEPAHYQFSNGQILDLEKFAWGIQIGDVNSTGALVSLRTTETNVTLHLFKASTSTPPTWQANGVFDNLEVTGGILEYELGGLTADTAYTLYFVPTNNNTYHSPAARFRTALNGALALRNITFGATSSLGRTNLPWNTLSSAAKEDLDFFMLLGDTIYSNATFNLAAGPSEFLKPPPDFKSKWDEALKTKGLNDLSLSTSFIATLNDHEYVENWVTLPPSWISSGRNAFKQSFPVRQANESAPGLYRSIKYGKVLEVLVLDTRNERSLVTNDTRIMSVEQMEWLKGRLSNSDAKFKVIMSSVPISNTSALLLVSFGSWSFFPDQRNELINHIVNNEIRGCVFISGDFQFGAVSSVESPPTEGLDDQIYPWGAWNLTEISVGPAGTRINPSVIFNSRISFATTQFPLVLDTWTYTRITADPVTGNMSVDFIDDLGTTVKTVALELYKV